LQGSGSTYLYRDGTRHLFSFIRSRLQRDGLTLARVDKQLLHTDNTQTEEVFVGSVVDFEQQLACTGAQVTADTTTRNTKHNFKGLEVYVYGWLQLLASDKRSKSVSVAGWFKAWNTTQSYQQG
jgi:hypothetical protein